MRCFTRWDVDFLDKHIMLLFLSDVKVSQKTGDIVATKYDDAGVAKTTNESAVRYLLRSGYQDQPLKLDRLFLFASKKVREEWIGGKSNSYKDADGKQWKHLEYFLDRLKDILPNIEQISAVYPFDEDAGMDDDMQMILAMADQIRQYVKPFKEKNIQVILHADCTGGMRHANMMMLGIMRLMQYSGVEIGRVLYSNFQKHKVEEAKSIYRFFDLIAGAEEFVRFGSVSAILDYYRGRQVSPALEKLLSTMRQFAEEIQLCRYGRFVAAIDELRTALKVFKERNESTLNEQIMLQMVERIEDEYGTLLQKNLDDLTLIRWCLKHGYLQQALTLYTERIPEYLGTSGIIQVASEREKQILCAKDTDVRSFYFYLLTIYIPGMELEQKNIDDEDSCCKNVVKSDEAASSRAEINMGEELLRKYRKKLKRTYQDILVKIDKREYSSDRLEQDFSAILNPADCFGFARWESMLEMFKGLELLGQKEELVRLKQPDSKDLFVQRLLRLYKIQKKNECADWNEENFNRLPGYKKYKEIMEYFIHMSDSTAWTCFSDIAGYARYIQLLLSHKVITTEVPQRQLFDIMNRYGVIKDERNHSNHAKEESGSFIASELKEYMLSGLDELESIRSI